MSPIYGIFLLLCLHGGVVVVVVTGNGIPERDMKIGFIPENRRTYLNSNDDENYGYVDDWRANDACDSVVHDEHEDHLDFPDIDLVINVEDADKIRRPHLYTNDPMSMSLMNNKTKSMQIIAVVGAVLVSIVGITGLACLYRHMNERKFRF